MYIVVRYLLGSSLDGAVLAGHVLAVPVVRSAAGQAQVGVALPHGQVAGTLLGVALSFAPTSRETVLTCGPAEGGAGLLRLQKRGENGGTPLTFRAALTELLTEVLGGDAGTGGVAGLPGVVAGLVVIHVVGRAVCSRTQRVRNEAGTSHGLAPVLVPFFSWILRQCVAHSLCFLFFFLGGVSSSSVGARAMMLDSLTLNS